jgi:peptide/nickel transport system substrate-binding protein
VRHALERVFRLRSVGASFYDAILGADRCADRPVRCDLSRGVITDDRRRTVTFRLRKPDPELLYKLALSYAYVVPADTPAGPIATRALPATGPYQIATYRQGHELRLIRNRRFREWSRPAQPDGYADEIVWKLGVRPDAAVDAILRGRADYAALAPGQYSLGQLPPSRRTEIRTRHARQLRTHDLLGTEYHVLNVRKAPFNDVRARRALNLAIDRRAVARLLSGASTGATPTCQLLPPQMPGYRRHCPYTARPDATGAWHAPDVARARRLVAASGTKGQKVVFVGTVEPPVAATAARDLARVLRQIGYRPRLRLVPEADYDRLASSQPRGTSDIASAGWGADYPSASNFLQLHLSCAARRPDSDDNPNISGFCSPRLDRMMQRALELQIASPSQADALWARVDREMTDQAVWVPLITPRFGELVSQRVGNDRFHPLWGPLIDQLWVR